MSDHQAISSEQVPTELGRILASRGFAHAGRLSRLLRHVVDRTLAGQADQLKEYSVGMEVFDRDDKYDPRVDSIVRVEAGRLRSRLDEYYNAEGAAAPFAFRCRAAHTWRSSHLAPMRHPRRLKPSRPRPRHRVACGRHGPLRPARSESCSR